MSERSTSIESDVLNSRFLNAVDKLSIDEETSTKGRRALVDGCVPLV